MKLALNLVEFHEDIIAVSIETSEYGQVPLGVLDVSFLDEVTGGFAVEEG